MTSNPRQCFWRQLIALTLVSGLASAQVLAEPLTALTPSALVERCESLEHGQPEEALRVASELLTNEAPLDAFAYARALLCRSWAHTQLGQTGDALRALDMALGRMAAMNDPIERIRVKSRAASVGYRLGRIDEAMELMTRGLNLAEANQLTAMTPELMGRLAIFQADSGQVDLALDNYRRALDMLDPATQQATIMPLRFNFAITLRRAQRPAEALDILDPILPLLRAPGMESRLASLLSLMGGLNLELDNREQALQLFEESLALHQTFDNPAERSALLRELTRLYRQDGDLARSALLGEESLALARRSADEQSIIHSLNYLVETREALGDFEQALIYHREMAERSTALLNRQLESRLADAEALLRDHQRESEVQQLRQERALRAIESEQQAFRERLWQVGSISLLIAALLALLIQRTNNKRLDKISRLDPLTQLPNRRALTAGFGRARSHAPDQCSVLFLLDLDHFKRINDQYGHDSGDKALLATAGLLREFAKQHQGLIGRWGGEEFAVQLRHQSAESAASVAEQLVSDIAALNVTAMDGRALKLSVSIGFAPIELSEQHSGQESWEPALNCADQLLYRAKKAGRNGWFGVWPLQDGQPLRPLELDKQIDSGQCRLLTRSSESNESVSA